MPKFRTKKNERTTYYYHDAFGRKIEIAPGMEGCDGQAVTADLIIMLHGWDDDEHNSIKKDDYHGVTGYEQESVDEGETVSDRNAETADHDADPARMLITAMDAAERSGAFKTEWDALNEQQRLLIKLLLRRTDKHLAREMWEALPDTERFGIARKLMCRNKAEENVMHRRAVIIAEADWDGLTEAQRAYITKALLWRTDKQLAEELGCTIEAFRSRLGKIQKRFEKFLK